jgi:hypothetical protein
MENKRPFMEFGYDWWFVGGYAERVELAKRRCARNHFPNLDPEKIGHNAASKQFLTQLEARIIIYLRDGFSYEVKELLQHPTTTTLTFECMPADDAYKVGCFVVTVPFEEIVRVEIFAFAVHPEEKPEDMPSIKGFASGQGPQLPQSRSEDRPRSHDRQDADSRGEPKPPTARWFAR